MVIVPVTGLRARRPHPQRTTVAAAAVPVDATPAAAAVDEHAEADRASRSAGWARRALEELPVDESTTTEAPSPPTTEAVVRKASVAPATTPTTAARPKATTSTTAKPKPAPTTTAPPKTATRDASPPTTGEGTQSGKASWYEAAPAGTCAHRTLPMGTIVTVTATSTGKSTTCRVADRGPYVNGWIIDLSKATFSQLAPLDAGVISVRLTW
jgi:rare lipoprotein A (peptidoglycan hydrolase)